jgi:hypothetical protein
VHAGLHFRNPFLSGALMAAAAVFYGARPEAAEARGGRAAPRRRAALPLPLTRA